MRHHGVTTVGTTAREAFSLMKEFVRAARIQLMMEQSARRYWRSHRKSASTSRPSMNNTTGGGRRLNGPPIFVCSTASIAAIATELAPRMGRRHTMNPLWILRTARLVLTPVGGADLCDLIAIKAAPQVFAIMLGGVRSPQQTTQELADDVAEWGAHGFGTWAIREQGHFLGITGLEHRPDGRGIALRFALWPQAQGRGLAREAAAPRCASAISR